jgi:hypothetical protein
MTTKPKFAPRDRSPTPNGGDGRSRRLSNAKLRELFLKETAGRSSLVAEPLDSGLWPTAGLSDPQIKQLTESLRRVRRYQLSKNGS